MANLRRAIKLDVPHIYIATWGPKLGLCLADSLPIDILISDLIFAFQRGQNLLMVIITSEVIAHSASSFASMSSRSLQNYYWAYSGEPNLTTHVDLHIFP